MQLQNKIHSESGHHYLKNPAYGWVFAFLRLLKPYLKFIPVSLPDEVAQPALPGGAALTGPTKPAGQIRRSRHPACFSAHKAKNPAPSGTGFF
ncbi:hypothetical protein ACWM30_002207, partial [Enterobacter hormaechei]